MKLWEILVPCMMNGNPVSTKHHKEWDKKVLKISGGLTLLKPISGKWVSDSGNCCIDRTIPVRVACSDGDLQEILKFSCAHYCQEAIMAYTVSDNVVIYHRK